MKLRTGFVSNSSSSSFIIATNGEAPIIRIEKDISSLIDTTISTKEELDEWLIRDYGWDNDNTVDQICADDSYAAKMYANCLAAIESGRVVHFGSASNESGSGLEAMIHDDGFRGTDCLNFTVIQECQ